MSVCHPSNARQKAALQSDLRSARLPDDFMMPLLTLADLMSAVSFFTSALLRVADSSVTIPCKRVQAGCAVVCLKQNERLGLCVNIGEGMSLPYAGAAGC